MPRVQLDPRTHEYACSDSGVWLPGVTRTLAEAGLVDTRWFKAEAAKRGTAVHMACQFHDEGDLDESTVDATLRPYLTAYRLFLAESGFKPLRIEESLAHPIYRYAGTFDRVGELNGAGALVDIKTGALVPETAIQTAAYAGLLDHPVRRFGLQLRANGRYSLKEYADRNDWKIWLAALAVANWRRGHRKTFEFGGDPNGDNENVTAEENGHAGDIASERG
jgi:hypothetical protein